ncbi:hypothetical protein VM1G_03113 [Cytospora mali]|uniref:Major facilitator superfamily (MFS) profile domain-containing protein n=1 Tax=Cytospora mali TaxID=578113 RepID=A0A194VTD8_CYTMA|nr:hypothetical protein VM1G_03113 [Valsa mali]
MFYTDATDCGSNSTKEINGDTPKSTPEEANMTEDITMPRSGLSISPGRWRAMVVMTAIFVFVNGYDISNTANIQTSIYKAYGHIELFSWITLGYCIGIAGLMPLVRRLAEVFDFRPMLLISTVIFALGSVIAGSSASLYGVIVGRAITGCGASGMTYLVVGYVAFFSKPADVARVQGMIGMMLSIGLIVGPLVGTGFASAPHATWRWAYYVVLPILGLFLVPVWLVFPSYTVPRPAGSTLWTQLADIDWVGAVLHAGTFLTLSMAMTLSGSEYDWSESSAMALWAIGGLSLCCYVIQQKFSIFTTPSKRIFPCHLLRNHTVVSANMGSFCAAFAYSIGLYYFPIFFSLVHGHSPVQSAVRFLPFIGVFIAGSIVAGGLLPVIGRYKIMYMIGGPIILTSGALITTQMRPSASESTVMGLEALLGFGAGLVFSYAMPISTAVLPPEELMAAACLSNLSTLGTISLSLSIAGVVFQNVGHRLLKDAMGPYGFSKQDIKLALGGAASPIWEASDPAIQKLAISAVAWTINTVFWLVLTAGAVCTVASLAMSWEKLDFRKAKLIEEEPRAEETEASTKDGESHERTAEDDTKDGKEEKEGVSD